MALQARGVSQGNSPQAEGLIEHGVQQLSRGNESQALDDFNRFKQIAPQDPRPYFYAGMALEKAGRLSAAALEVSEAIRLAPDRPEYHIFLADVLCRIKQKAAAADTLAILEKQGNLERLESAWLRLLVDAYYRLEKADDALRVLGILNARLPDDPDIALNMGQAYALKGDTEHATEFLKKSVAKTPRNPTAYFELGKVLYQRNEMAAAKQALLEAVKLDQDNPEYLYRLGAVCLAQGGIEEAIGYLRRAEPGASGVPQIYNALGQAYHLKGEREKGDEYRRKFQEITTAEKKENDRKWEIERLIYQGEMQLDKGNKAEARALFERAAEADPNRWDPHGYLVEMFLASGELDKAYPHLVKMEEIEPDSVVGNYLAAQYWVARGDYARARPLAEKAKFGRPGNSELRSLLGSIYRELGQNEKASEEFRAAVRLAPDRADYREQLRKLEAGEVTADQNPSRR
ncbi:MAG: tetratricopeptide repeat protein [Terriglobia bacterium]